MKKKIFEKPVVSVKKLTEESLLVGSKNTNNAHTATTQQYDNTNIDWNTGGSTK